VLTLPLEVLECLGVSIGPKHLSVVAWRKVRNEAQLLESHARDVGTCLRMGEVESVAAASGSGRWREQGTIATVAEGLLQVGCPELHFWFSTFKGLLKIPFKRLLACAQTLNPMV